MYKRQHYIADALSRAPVFAPEEEEFTIDCAITHCRQIKEGSEIMHTFAGLQQEEYKQLIEATLEGKDFSKLPLTHPARAYKSIADRISVSKAGTTDVAMLDSTRIIVPPNAVQSIMKELHRAHWSEWRLTVIAATVRIALVDILDLYEVDIPAGGFLYLSLIHI